MSDYIDHARRHAAGGSDPLVFTAASAYCQASTSAQTRTTAAALDTDVVFDGGAAATDTTRFSFDSGTNKIHVNQDGTYLVEVQLGMTPNAGFQLPSVAIIYPLLSGSFGRTSHFFSGAHPYSANSSAYPQVGVNKLGGTWGFLLFATSAATSASPAVVYSHVKAPNDATGTYTYIVSARIFLIHDGPLAISGLLTL